MPRRESIAVILNAAAGSARADRHTGVEIADLFRAAGCDADVIELTAGQSPTDAAREASKRAAIVVAAGGDGTVSGIAAAVAGSATALGILPLGTLNHFAKDLGIPLTLPDAIAVVAAGHLARVDAAEVNERIFINNASIGIYPGIVEEREELQRQGHRKWPAMAVATLRLLRRYRGVTVRADVHGVQRIWRTPFVMAGNNEYAVEGLDLGGRPALDRGLLFVYVAPRARTRDLPLLLAKALFGRVSRSGGLEVVPATTLTIDTPRGSQIRVSVDGEVVTMRSPLAFRSRPGALRVVVPNAAPDAAPPAR